MVRKIGTLGAAAAAAAYGSPGSGAVTTSYTDLRTQARNLYGFYVRRAARQQAWLDVGSMVTVGAAAGAFQGNISEQNRQAWAIAAFVPSVFSQLNAYEPTRELFEGGALAVKLITARYDRYMQATQLLETTLPTAAAGAAPGAPLVDCTASTTLVRDVVKAREDKKITPRYDSEGVFLAEARRLETACNALNERATSLRFTATYARTYRAMLVARYADDILLLDEALAAKDRDMRYTPVQTLSALIASPLRAVDFAITGQDTSAAVSALQTQTAFSGLNRSLAGIRLPGLPQAGAVATVAPLSTAALALSGSGPDLLKQHIVSAQAEAYRLANLQSGQAFSEETARDLLDSVNADYLTFTYDPVGAVTKVMVGPKPETPALLTASTAVAPIAP